MYGEEPLQERKQYKSLSGWHDDMTDCFLAAATKIDTLLLLY